MHDLIEIVADERTHEPRLDVNMHRGQTLAWDSRTRFTAIIAGTQSGKCAIIGTMILMADGSRKAIQDIQAGDLVLSLSDDLKISSNRVTASFSTGIQRAFRLTTASGRTITTTAEHPLYSQEGWKPLSEFKVGDFIGVPRAYPLTGVVSHPETEMRLLGYLIGDGSVSHTSPRFSNIDEAILADVRRCLPNGYALRPTAGSDCDYTITNNQGQKRSIDDIGRFVGHDNPVIELCREWGIWGKTSKEKRIPDRAFELDNISLAPMLAALFDCDATVDRKGIEIVLASEGLIQDTQHLLLRFGIVARKLYKPVKLNGKQFHSWRLSFTDLGALETYATNIGFVGAKKHRLAELIASKQSQRANGKDLIPNFNIKLCYDKLGTWKAKQGYPDQKGYALVRQARHTNVSRAVAQSLADYFGVDREKAYSDIYWDTVREIAALDNQPMWDITVEDGHNYIADDIFAHNTSWGPLWLYREIYGWADPDDPFEGRGAGDYIGVTANYDLFKLKMLPALRYVFEELFEVGRYWTGERILELRDPDTGKFWAAKADDRMWGRVILRSANAAGGLESATAKGGWLDEAGHDDFPLAAWEAIQRRIAIMVGRLLLTTTPYNLGWLKQQVYDKWQRGDRDYNVIQFDSTMNPQFSQEELDRAERDLPDWKFRMMYKGQFERPAGMIYSDFVDKMRSVGGHKITPFELPHEWPRFVGIDPGLENQARVWMAHDTEMDIYYVYRTERPEKKSSGEHAQDVLATARNNRENVVMWTVGTKSEEQQRLDWQTGGVPAVEPPYFDVESGIDAGIALLRQRRVYFFEDDGDNGMRGLFDEIGTYSRKLDENGNATDEIKDKEKYHRLDAWRYCVAGTGQVYEDAGGINQAQSHRIGSSSY